MKEARELLQNGTLNIPIRLDRYMITGNHGCPVKLRISNVKLRNGKGFVLGLRSDLKSIELFAD
jgi:hypothetical protein